MCLVDNGGPFSTGAPSLCGGLSREAVPLEPPESGSGTNYEKSEDRRNVFPIEEGGKGGHGERTEHGERPEHDEGPEHNEPHAQLGEQRGSATPRALQNTRKY